MQQACLAREVEEWLSPWYILLSKGILQGGSSGNDGGMQGIVVSKLFRIATCRKQQVSDFLDEDEAAEAATKSLRVAPGFDTFGAAAVGDARAMAAAEAAKRSDRLPDLLPSELLAPVQKSIGETPKMAHVQKLQTTRCQCRRFTNSLACCPRQPSLAQAVAATT